MPQVFAEPGRLWLLVLLAVVALFVARGASRRRTEWAALGLIGRPPSNGVWLWWVAGFCSILALAGPRWGRQPGIERPPGHDLVLMIDVSRSMGAEDAVPDRLHLATRAARSLLDQLRAEPGDRAALVAFAGRAVVRCPLTASLTSVADRLDELLPGSVEPGGTDLGAGLLVTLDLFDATEHAEGRSIVIFSDGEDHEGTWPSVIGPLVDAQIPVHVVAVGDPERSTPVPALTDLARSAESSPSPPLTRRNDAALTQLAYATGGAVVPLGLVAPDLGLLYRDVIRPTTRDQRPPPRFSERANRATVCLAAALAAGVWGTWPLSRRQFAANRANSQRGSAWGRVLIVALIALTLLVIALAATPISPDAAAESATTRGTTAYRAGQFAEALAAFEEAIALAPTNPVGSYDAGAALFELGRFPKAVACYDVARDLATRQGWTSLTAKIAYASGNCLAMIGDFAGAIQQYDECLAATSRRSDLSALRRDAAINREYAIAQLTPPPERSAGDQPGGNEPDNSSDPPGPKSDPRPDPTQNPNSPSTGNESADGSDASSAGKRGPGGAGGSGAALPESDSPAGQLEAALRRIRSAKEKHPESPRQPPRPAGGRNSGKDW